MMSTLHFRRNCFAIYPLPNYLAINFNGPGVIQYCIWHISQNTQRLQISRSASQLCVFVIHSFVAFWFIRKRAGLNSLRVKVPRNANTAVFFVLINNRSCKELRNLTHLRGATELLSWKFMDFVKMLLYRKLWNNLYVVG